MADFRCGDVVAVPDEAQLWRTEKVTENFVYWSHELGRWVPRLPHALVFNKELSTFWSQHLIGTHDGTPTDVHLVRQGPAAVFRCRAGDLRTADLTLAHCPSDESEIPTPPGCAHVLAAYPESATREEKNRFRQRIVALMTLDPEDTPIPFEKPPL